MLRNKLLLISTLFLFLLQGCSSVMNKKQVTLPQHKLYAIGSFWNYTETPMAGLRAASIVEGVMAQHNINISSMVGSSDQLEKSESKLSFLQNAKKQALQAKANYLITGDVQEWRYKTGIDGEPVVSYSIKIIDLNSDQIVFSAIAAKSGWGHKSIGVVAQEIAQELIPNFVQ